MKKKKKISWSKLLLVFLFLNFTALEMFVGYVTLRTFTLASEISMMPDFTPLISLIGAVIGETLSYGIYCAKAKAENTVGGLVYESTLKELENEKNMG